MMSVVKSREVKMFAKMLHVKQEARFEIPSRMLSVNFKDFQSRCNKEDDDRVNKKKTEKKWDRKETKREKEKKKKISSAAHTNLFSSNTFIFVSESLNLKRIGETEETCQTIELLSVSSSLLCPKEFGLTVTRDTGQ